MSGGRRCPGWASIRWKAALTRPQRRPPPRQPLHEDTAAGYEGVIEAAELITHVRLTASKQEVKEEESASLMI